MSASLYITLMACLYMCRYVQMSDEAYKSLPFPAAGARMLLSSSCKSLGEVQGKPVRVWCCISVFQCCSVCKSCCFSR